MSDFAVESKQVPRNAAILTLRGGMDDNDFDTLLREFRTVLDAGVLGVVLDVSDLTAVSSAGLGAMLDLGKTLAVREGKMFLAAPTDELAGTLELLGIGAAFDIVPTVGEGQKIVSVLGMT